VHLVRTGGFDTVFSSLVHANFIAARASRQLPGVRFLQSVQTVQPRPRWHWWAQRWAHRRAERVVVPSNAIVKFAGRQSGISESKFVVVPNAVDPADFPRVGVFQGAKIRAGYLGRLDPAKNPGMLVQSIGFAAMPEAELHYFGDGPYRPALERAAAERRGERTIVVHGSVARPQDALRLMDVLWQPSNVEGFGLVIIEAMASGVPVVASAAGAGEEIVRDRQNGFLAESQFQYRAYARALWQLRDDPALRKRIIEGGLRTVREKYTWDVVLPQYRKLLGL
jgi:glycosyltransferase involved in cell wall biosynthesis